MQRKRFFPRPERRAIPGRIRAAIMLRQEGRCADCGTRLILGFVVYDHRPPLALREPNDEVNDPERLAAICWTCNERKTPRDLKEIARNNRIARKHQEFLERQREKQPGRHLPSRKQWRELFRRGFAQPSVTWRDPGLFLYPLSTSLRPYGRAQSRNHDRASAQP